MATLRDFLNISYIVTTLADLEGYHQRSPEQQVVPEDWQEKFISAEVELKSLTDAGMDLLVTGDHDDENYDDLAERAPTAVEVLNHVAEGQLHSEMFARS